jgi:hypothetical protein
VLSHTWLGVSTHVPLLNVHIIRRHDTAVEALPFVALSVFVRLTGSIIARTDYGMTSRPEFERDNVTWQGVDAVGREKMSPFTDFDRVYVDFVFCHDGRGVVDGANRPVNHIAGLETPDEWQKEGVLPPHPPGRVSFPNRDGM